MSIPTPTTITPEEQAELDRLANDELYQQFLRTEEADGKRGEQAAIPPQAAPSSEGTTDTDTSGVDTDSTSGGGGGEAPTSPPPEIFSGRPEETEETPPVAPTTDSGITPEPSAVQELVTLGGVNLTQEQTQQLIGLWNWASNMDEDQRTLVDAVLTGHYDLVLKGSGTETPTPPVVLPSTQQAPPTLPDTDDLSPEVRTYLSSLEQRLGSLAAATEEARLRQEQEQATILRSAVTEGTKAFQSKYNLEEAEAIALTHQVATMQILPSYATRYPGQPAAAMNAALEAVYWTTPQYQQREVERRLAAERAAQTSTDTKTAKASSLTGGGGSVPRTEPPAQTGRQATIQGIADEIRNAQNNGASA